MQELDQRDRDLLGILQSEIPISSTPFAIIGQMIEMSEKEVIKRTDRLKVDGTIRQISAIFDGRALGYQSCLIAARVPEETVDQAAGAISAHPGVTQNYRRNHPFNLWFTINISPRSRLGLERTVELLGGAAGAEAMLRLPTLRLLKGEGDAVNESQESESQAGTPVADAEIDWIRLLQRDLPLQPRPFDTLGRSTNTEPEEILAWVRRFKDRQQLRKLAAIVTPRKPAFSATTMGVWNVADDRVQQFSDYITGQRAVSHCYLRPRYEDWPYNVFTTVHGRSVDECESILQSIASETGVDAMKALFPTKEFKKSRITWFAADQEQWEEQFAGSATASAAS